MRDEVDPQASELLERENQLLHAASETIESPDLHHVKSAASGVGHEGNQSASPLLRSARFVGVDVMDLPAVERQVHVVDIPGLQDSDQRLRHYFGGSCRLWIPEDKVLPCSLTRSSHRNQRENESMSRWCCYEGVEQVTQSPDHPWRRMPADQFFGMKRMKSAVLIGCNLLKIWWPGTESNRRQPFQG